MFYALSILRPYGILISATPPIEGGKPIEKIAQKLVKHKLCLLLDGVLYIDEQNALTGSIEN